MTQLTTDAPGILINAADAISERAAVRDQPTGERSMARTVGAFNAMYGARLTEEQGWQFMALLKMARSSAGRTHLDDYTDQAGYSALAGECAARVLTLGQLPHSFNQHHRQFGVPPSGEDTPIGDLPACLAQPHAKPYAPA